MVMLCRCIWQLQGLFPCHLVHIPPPHHHGHNTQEWQENHQVDSSSSEPDFMLRHQGEEKLQFVTLQVMEVLGVPSEALSPEDFLPPPTSATIPEHEADTEDDEDWTDIPRGTTML